MKSLTLLLAFLASVLLLAPAATAQAQPFTVNPPSHVVLPVPDGGMVKVMWVGPNRVRLWGFCPIPSTDYAFSVVDTTGPGPARAEMVHFETAVHAGYYTLKGLMPGHTYSVRVWVLDYGPNLGLAAPCCAPFTWVTVGTVHFETPLLPKTNLIPGKLGPKPVG